MNCRLRSYELNPPGNFFYEQTEGIYRKFHAEPLIEAQAANVSSFRRGNGLPRSSITEALQDIDSYTCQRLGCDNRYCVSRDSNSAPVTALNESSPILSPGCRGCGARLHS